jgi:hypothetical protein
MSVLVRRVGIVNDIDKYLSTRMCMIQVKHAQHELRHGVVIAPHFGSWNRNHP